ncbi:LacI family transcriptional regulator [Brachybacterium huguangmaarense]|uniref:LacI family transcriptional regulator n=1 Tax=Brachybacterium huguangmaarense TaxID=1652028 RepID=A0ABY6G164_9MICO|nr:LacI family DNA-binding transcriptional regulator [Brachybacterium huguangmaarense]UYG16719.1 LacI family transcriptional regulator [Brachybacterium huguangmaarense]
MAKTRLKDIAERAGVSESTVSRVLNRRSGIAEETQRLVREAARELGHHDVGEEGELVGVLVPDLENPIFCQWADRLEAELFERGAASIISTRARGIQGEAAAFERFLRLDATGVVVVSGFHAQPSGPVEHYRRLVHEGVSLALINGVREEIDATFISTDDDHAMRLATAHLRELGHTAIGLAVGDERTWPVRQKVRTFEGLIDHEQSPARDIAFTDFSYAGGYQAARELIERGCTAIVCGSDVMAAGALEGVRSLGLAVPADVSVIGYDDAQWAGLTNPALTTVRQSVPEMARAAVRAVLEGGEGSRRAVRSEVAMMPQLIVRGSTGAAPHVRR